MAIKKITFTNANVTAQNDADLYYFLQGGTGILKGIKNEVKASNNANRFIFESGYISIYGRLLFVDNNTDITVPLNRTAKGYIVLDINTATNSAELTYTESTNGGYPILIQENLSSGVGHYQFPLAAYSKTGAALTPDQSFKPAYLYPHIEKQQGSTNANKVFMTDASGNFILVDTIPVSAIPATGVSVDTAKQLEKTDGTKIGADEVALKKDFNNVDNTSDMDKPISNATQKALDKTLYNLGAFDTISGNVITRQTGYIDNEKLANANWVYQNNYPRFYVELDTLNLPRAIANDYTINCVCNILDGVAVNTTLTSGTDEIAIGGAYLFIRKTDITSVDDLKNWLSQKPIQIQYELSTSYTEEIIEGQPLITLNSQGSQWLRDEWEKGLNLFDKTKATNGKALGEWTLFDSENMSASDIIYVKPNTTYTFNYVRVLCFGDINGNYISGSRKFLDSTNFTFTTPSNCYCIKFDTTIERLDTIMLNEGTEPLPYQEYNGSIVREKQLNELDNKKANKSETYTKEETDSALSSAKSYTDTKIANLVGTAPETMDTLEEVANAIKEHQDVADALNAAIGNKANSSYLNAHTSNTSNPHNVTKTQLGLENVDNTKDIDKNVASAKILKNNEIGSFTLSEGIVNGIDFNSNSVYLIYDSHWNFIIRIGDKSKNSYVKSTVCYDDNSKSKPLWFYYENNPTSGLKLYLKTLSDTSYVQNYSYNGTFNYKLLSTD